MFKLRIGFACVLALSAASAGHANVSWGGWFLDTQVSATVIIPPVDSDSDSASAFDNNLPTPVAVTRSLSSLASYDSASVQAAVATHSNLNFLNPQSLTLDVSTEWNLTTSPVHMAFVNGGANFAYSFNTDKEYFFTLDYDIETDILSTIATSFLGLGGQNGYIFLKTQIMNDVGKFSGVIGPGSYYLQINNSNVATNNVYNAPAVTGQGAGTFKFTLSDPVVAAPEPATWAMMISGLGFVGASMRRRSAKISFV